MAAGFVSGIVVVGGTVAVRHAVTAPPARQDRAVQAGPLAACSRGARAFGARLRARSDLAGNRASPHVVRAWQARPDGSGATGTGAGCGNGSGGATPGRSKARGRGGPRAGRARRAPPLRARTGACLPDQPRSGPELPLPTCETGQELIGVCNECGPADECLAVDFECRTIVDCGAGGSEPCGTGEICVRSACISGIPLCG